MFNKPTSPDHTNLANIHSYGVNPETREIYINTLHHMSDSGELGVDFSMAAQFIKNMHYLENLDTATIVIHCCSVGGDWNYGMAIYDAIKNSPCQTIYVAHAHARSMSSIMPQAADYRFIMPHCDFMIHYGTIALAEVSQAAKSSVDWNEKLSQDMLAIYSERCYNSHEFGTKGIPHSSPKSRKEIEEFLDEKMRYHVDWWLSAKEAVDYGFMDAVLESSDLAVVKNLASRV